MAQTPAAESQLEQITANTGDAETEDDYYQQQLEYFRRHPLNLNTAEPDELRELGLLSPNQLMNFIRYRKLLGKLIDVYELQAVPGWDIGLIAKLRPFITVNTAITAIKGMREKLRDGESTLMARLGRVLESAKGFGGDIAAGGYAGSRDKVLVRYKYKFKNVLQYGLVAEKDAGEQFFRGSQRKGFDFYSAHFFMRGQGVIKAIALGDYSVNLGQGLVQWQGMSASKTADVLHIKQEADALRPYNGSGEISFYRGAGIVLQHKNVKTTLFISYRKMDGNIIADSTRSFSGMVSSLQTSGYHRTKNEIADKGVQQQFVAGGIFRYSHKGFQAGINMVRHQFGLPLEKEKDLYTLYAVSGSRFMNCSVDYSYTFRNMHFFGEAAVNEKYYKAFITGMLLSAGKNADVGLLYRNISPGYHSFYSAAFTENTEPSNEQGFFMGLSVRPVASFRIDAYADFFKFPWLKYRVPAPSSGTDYLVQVRYNPGKQVEIYSRLSLKSSPVNEVSSVEPIPPVSGQKRKSWRTQVKYILSSSFTWQARVETVWLQTDQGREQGFLGYSDLFFRPGQQKWALNGRLQFFDTNSYNSRLYAYENDVPYSNLAPVFYGRGFRTYLNASYSINNKITIWVKAGQTVYNGKNTIGTGPDEISGNRKTEIKLQVQHKF
ncbi:MAG: helix-hairpin-helix domain-containing protein [Ferruginibacter sp.]